MAREPGPGVLTVTMIVRTCLVTALLGAVSGPANAELVDRVLAVVQGQLITLSDVVASREFRLVPAVESEGSVDAVLDALIDRTLILHEVDLYAPPEPDPEELDRELLAIRSLFPSVSRYQAMLERTGLEERHLRERLKDDLRIRAYLNQRFSVAPASEEDLVRFYQDHPGEFSAQGQVEPFDLVRGRVEQAVAEARRLTLVRQWVGDLRSRASIFRVPGDPEPPDRK